VNGGLDNRIRRYLIEKNKQEGNSRYGTYAASSILSVADNAYDNKMQFDAYSVIYINSIFEGGPRISLSQFTSSIIKFFCRGAGQQNRRRRVPRPSPGRNSRRRLRYCRR
jgi:hypothetical protein